ncbi:hypothetical protein RIF29_19064 [Crotalaria pallida]|uniref:Uncharacterized protein n=1 Tax=Crotalaria pallida TaxID=3830 RepID=A0AAN9F148_CROPI
MRQQYRVSKVRSIISSELLDFLAIQDTKCEMVNSRLCSSPWGSDDCGWSFAASIRRAGGLINLWCNKKFHFISSFVGDGYAGVCLALAGVYSPCAIEGKRSLWASLLNQKQVIGGNVWCVLGDFNAVYWQEERRGSTQQIDLAEIIDFNQFICDMGLSDLPHLCQLEWLST